MVTFMLINFKIKITSFIILPFFTLITRSRPPIYFSLIQDLVLFLFIPKPKLILDPIIDPFLLTGDLLGVLDSIVPSLEVISVKIAGESPP